MHVHPVLPWNLKLQQPQLLRSEPDEQPTESSQLATRPAVALAERRIPVMPRPHADVICCANVFMPWLTSMVGLVARWQEWRDCANSGREMACRKVGHFPGPHYVK